MSSRPLALGVLTLLIAFGSPAFAKEKKKKPAKQTVQTWKTLVEFVLKNGGEDSIKAPTSRTLGYDSDEVLAKSLGLDSDKSKDGRDHTIFIIYEKDGTGTAIPKEIVLGSIRVKESELKTEIDSYRIRMSLSGIPIRGMHATGIVGQVVQQALPSDSKELLPVLKKETDLFLKDVDPAQLTQ